MKNTIVHELIKERDMLGRLENTIEKCSSLPYNEKQDGEGSTISDDVPRIPEVEEAEAETESETEPETEIITEQQRLGLTANTRSNIEEPPMKDGGAVHNEQDDEKDSFLSNQEKLLSTTTEGKRVYNMIPEQVKDEVTDGLEKEDVMSPETNFLRTQTGKSSLSEELNVDSETS